MIEMGASVKLLRQFTNMKIDRRNHGIVVERWENDLYVVEFPVGEFFPPGQPYKLTKRPFRVMVRNIDLEVMKCQK